MPLLYDLVRVEDARMDPIRTTPLPRGFKPSYLFTYDLHSRLVSPLSFPWPLSNPNCDNICCVSLRLDSCSLSTPG
jgi:hypothetical protein